MNTTYSSFNHHQSSANSDVLGNIGRMFTSLGDKLEKNVQSHLKNVYGTLALMMGMAFVGGLMNSIFVLDGLHFLFTLGIFGLMMAIAFTEPSRANENMRLGYLLTLALLVGCTTGPLVEFIGAHDPSIVINAYLITLIVFGSFTLAALHAESTKFLHLGGILMSALFCLMISTLFRSAFINTFILWGGLAINCGFVLYDTQLIAEKRRRGDDDYISHSMLLFVDFINIFRYTLVLLKEKNDRDKRRR